MKAAKAVSISNRHWLALALVASLLGACNSQPSQPAPTQTPAVAQPSKDPVAATPDTPDKSLPVAPTGATSGPTAPADLAQATSIAANPATQSGLSIYNDSIPKTQAKRILIPELNLMRDALQLLAAKGWDGNIDRPLPLGQSDFDPAKLRAYIAHYQSEAAVVTVPPDMEGLYLSASAANDIAALLLRAHDEYVGYLKAKGIPQPILDEMALVLPPDLARIVYHAINKADVPPSAVDGMATASDSALGLKDYSRYKLEVYTVDLVDIATDLGPSLIMGPEPVSTEAKLARLKEWRDMAVRKLVYHEMTHVLQRAFINLHVHAAKYRTSESAYLWASQSLAAVSAGDHWQWGGASTVADGDNQHLSNESQADGIAFEVLSAVYNLSSRQREAVWDHLYGRLDDARAAIDEIRTLCETRFPALVPDSFGSPLADVFSDYALKKLAFRLTNLSADAGYLHPLRPERTAAFWQAASQP